MNTPDSYLSYFTPGQMSHETLEFILVKRQRLLERLVERVSHSALTDAKHHSLLLGPRGMGKSHMVALTYYRVKALPELQGKIALAWLAEEEWGVASLADLFLIILKALAREYPNSDLAAEIDAFYKLPYDQIENAAAQKLRDFVGNRTLFLLVENLEEIFRGLGKDGQWAFRSFLSERPFITILATTPSLFAGIQTQQDAFYGFFTPSYLDELTTEEATELLGKVAEHCGDASLTKFLKTRLARDRVQAVHDLAGGHPRIYLLFAHLVTEKNLDELVTPFRQLLDELTPYYQSRMLLLAPQQRKIVEFLCDHRGALPVKEIAVRCLLSPQTTAAQLGDLEQKEYLQKNVTGRESHYELREPLLRMVVEIKRGRGEPISLIVDFLRRWYSREERHAHLANTPISAALTQQYWKASLDIARSFLDTPNLKRAKRLSARFQQAFKAEEYALASEIAAEVLEQKGKASSSEDFYYHTHCCLMSGNYTNAMSSIVKLIEIFPENHGVWFLQGTIFIYTQQFHEALHCFDRAIAISPTLSGVWRYRGNVCDLVGEYDNALFSYSKCLEIDQTNSLSWLLHAKMLLRKNSWEGFQQSLIQGLNYIEVDDNCQEITKEYLAILLSLNNPEEYEQTAALFDIYQTHQLIPKLGQGLLQSLADLTNSDISQNRAEAWLAAWTAAGANHSEMTVPLRLLAAAVAWKPKHDPRALLVLAIEERRILESLLPKGDAE